MRTMAVRRNIYTGHVPVPKALLHSLVVHGDFLGSLGLLLRCLYNLQVQIWDLLLAVCEIGGNRSTQNSVFNKKLGNPMQ